MFTCNEFISQEPSSTLLRAFCVDAPARAGVGAERRGVPLMTLLFPLGGRFSLAPWRWGCTRGPLGVGSSAYEGRASSSNESVSHESSLDTSMPNDAAFWAYVEKSYIRPFEAISNLLKALHKAL